MKQFSIISILCLVYFNINAQYIVPQESIQGGACCCGQFVEIFFPNLDFESPPSPAPGTFFTYGVGQNFGGWTVTLATIDHCDALVGNLGAGNPNGATYFIDLHGSPGLGGISYNLFGLTPGNQYRIEFWTAQNGGGFSSTGMLKIAGGAWLNVSWVVSTSGAVSWRKETYEFMAMGSSATMEFSSTGPMVFAGTLVDDIRIFECPGDSEKPEVLNPPDDLDFECLKEVPKAPNLLVSDNCDPNPQITLQETIEIIDPCTRIITRKWEIKDGCGNITEEDQIIHVMDLNPPQFTIPPDDKIISCDKDYLKEFNDWIKKNANANAIDACGAVSWRTNYDRVPRKSCDTILVEFIVKDHCGNENFEYASFYVIDTLAPKFSTPAQTKNLVCIPNARDSLREWLVQNGYSKTTTDCDTVLLSSNFDGDSTKNPMHLTFYAKDRCGNIDSSSASFSYRSGSDTFRIKEYSCNFIKNSFDTLSYIINGCDSIVIKEKIKQLADSLYFKYNTCDSSHALFDTVRLINRNSCDSLIFNEYILRQISITRLQEFDCKISKIQEDTMVLMGQYCDSLVIIEYFPLRKDTVQIYQTTCDKTKADTLVQSLKNILGCDSLVTIFTIFSPQQITLLNENICGLVTSYIDTVKHSNGFCDSLVITTYSALPLDTTYLQNYTCDKTKAGIFEQHRINQYGCDSLIIEEVFLNPSDSTFFTVSTCILNQSGVTIQRSTNQYGCDSIIQTTNQFIPSDTINILLTTCDVKAERTDTLILKGRFCDSLILTNYSFIPADTNYIFEFTCDIQTVGKDTMYYTAQVCDSVVIRTKTYTPSDTISLNLISCNPVDEGTDTLVLKNKNFCDSVVYRHTRFVPLGIQLQLDSISCFNRADGRINITNWNSFTKPVQLFLNNLQQVSNSSLANLSAGMYSLRIIDAKDCVSNEIFFELKEPNPFSIDIGTDLEVNAGEEILLDLKSNQQVQHVQWIPYSCSNCLQLIFKATMDTWVIAQAINTNQCPASDSIFLRVKKKGNIYAPNSFSPNGDNINDYFYIHGEDDFIVERLSIYDRWGEKVFETHEVLVNTPRVGWDGTFNSQKMIPGVYIYTAKIRTNFEEIFEIRGDLTLIR